MGDKQHHATRRQLIQINDLLREHLVDAGNGFWIYAPDWSDEKISLIVDVAKTSVAASRLECYGKFPTKAAVAENTGELRSRVAVLEGQVAMIDARIAKLEGKIQIAFPNFDLKDSAVHLM